MKTFVIRNKKTGGVIWKKPLIEGTRLASIDYLKQNGKTTMAVELVDCNIFGEQYHHYETFDDSNDGFVLTIEDEDEDDCCHYSA